MKRLLTATVLLGAVAGCGGEDAQPLSATAFRDRANAICRDLQATNEKAFKGLDTSDREVVIKATNEVGKRTQDALAKLDDLEGPAASEAAIDRILEAGRSLGEATARQSEALASGKSDEAKR